MAKFDCGQIDHASFNAIKGTLVAELAEILESQLIAMGEDCKGISWFSSAAYSYAADGMRLAA